MIETRLTPADVERAIELLKAGWTKGAYARNGFGTDVRVSDPDACSFCTMGAFDRAVYERTGQRTWVDLTDLSLFYQHHGLGGIATTNDSVDSVDPIISLLEEYRAQL
jgi:hypothetical protein